MKIAAITQGVNVPSARFRIRQLIPELSRSKIYVEELIASPGAYPPKGLGRRVIWGGQTGYDAFQRSWRSRAYDATILQRELVSTLPTFEWLVKRPFIADVDDAIWLRKNGISAKALARFASYVVAGNNYIAENFRALGAKTVVIPTAVDTARFEKLNFDAKQGLTIGWSGMSSGYPYLESIIPAISEALRSHKHWKLKILSNSPPPLFPCLPRSRIEYISWSSDIEAQQISEMDIGVMPLDSSPWSLGKCSYKMLLYMACGIPVVVSSFGMNREILALKKVGFGAVSLDDWATGLKILIDNPSLRADLGENGRELIKDKFSIGIVAESWLQLIAEMKRF